LCHIKSELFHIKALRKLDLSQVNIFQVLQCFIKNRPYRSKASYQVYQTIMPNLLLIEENFKDIKMHPQLEEIAYALQYLNDAKILTQENFDAIKTRPSVLELRLMLDMLNDVELLTQESFNAIKSHHNLLMLICVLAMLNDVKLLTQENFNIIRIHPNLSVLIFVLNRLKNAKILTQESFDIIKTHPNILNQLDLMLNKINDLTFLTQENFLNIASALLKSSVSVVDTGQYTESEDCSQKPQNSARFFSLQKNNVESYTHRNDSTAAQPKM
jgi:hypothetical protein